MPLNSESNRNKGSCLRLFKKRAVKISKAGKRFDHLETQHLVLLLAKSGTSCNLGGVRTAGQKSRRAYTDQVLRVAPEAQTRRAPCVLSMLNSSGLAAVNGEEVRTVFLKSIFKYLKKRRFKKKDLLALNKSSHDYSVEQLQLLRLI